MNGGGAVVPLLDWPVGLRLLLGSASPRRTELLTVAGIPHDVQPPPPLPADVLAAARALRDTDPDGYALRLAAAKARAVAGAAPDRLVLGADTIVVLDGEVLEKPGDAGEALAMLERLSGRTHTVITAVALARGPALLWHDRDRTRVTFADVPRRRLARYVATGEPLDKAGAYGIQGYGALLVRRLEGCYFNVMGLPLALLAAGLDRVLGTAGEAGP